MAGGIIITSLKPILTFEKDYSKLTQDQKDQVDECLKDLMKNPRPAGINFEKLNNYKNPNIYTIHVSGNHCHKLSMEIEAGVAKLRRVRTHKKINYNP